jgi:hypothetical protein
VSSTQIRTCGTDGHWGSPTNCTTGCQNNQCQ